MHDDPHSPEFTPTRQDAVRDALRAGVTDREGGVAAAAVAAAGVAAASLSEVGALTDHRVRLASAEGDRLEGWVTSHSKGRVTLDLDNGAKLAIDLAPWRTLVVISRRDPDGTVSPWDSPRRVEFVEPDAVLADAPTADGLLFRLRDCAAVTIERASQPIEVLHTSVAAADALRDAARELAGLVNAMDARLTAGANPPLEWRSELTSPDDHADPDFYEVLGRLHKWTERESGILTELDLIALRALLNELEEWGNGPIPEGGIGQECSRACSEGHTYLRGCVLFAPSAPTLTSPLEGASIGHPIVRWSSPDAEGYSYCQGDGVKKVAVAGDEERRFVRRLVIRADEYGAVTVEVDR